MRGSLPRLLAGPLCHTRRMRILVTGGAGYIGSITARHILEQGLDVTVLDSLVRGHRAAVPEAATFVEADIADRAAVDAALEGCDAVIHCSGYIEVAESVAKPELYLRNNVTVPESVSDPLPSLAKNDAPMNSRKTTAQDDIIRVIWRSWPRNTWTW